MTTLGRELKMWMRCWLTGHFCDTHGSVFGDGVRAFARQTSKRIRRGDVDDNTSTNITGTVPAGPCFWFLLTHCRSLCTHTEKVAPSIDVHDAIEILDLGISQGCMYTVVDLEDRASTLAPMSYI